MARWGCALSIMVYGAGVLGPAAAAEPGRTTEMKGPAAAEAQRRVVLTDVPKVRYIADGMCPFALAVKCLTQFQGKDISYGHILGTSGAAFRMAWNHTGWDEGNMDLSHFGPEPFRRGLQCAGYRPGFLVKPGWWPGQTAADLRRVANSAEGRADLREAITASLDRGLPVLGIGVVGPPEVSLIAGYDEGGEVLIGWSCHAEAHPPRDGFEPNGMFRQRDWWEATPGVILLDGELAEADVRRVRREALEWAYRVMTMPKGPTHEFGEPAYKGWCFGLVRDYEFPEGDETTLQSRRFTVWDGLIMQAERGRAAAWVEQEAERRPGIEAHLREAARHLRAEGDLSADAAKALGGSMLPSADLADPVRRRAAIDVILACRDHYVQATRHLALALGREPPGVVQNARELDGLRPAYRTMTLLGTVLGCMRYAGKGVDPAWLYGVTGAAFMLNIDRQVDVSGPTSWGVREHFAKMLPYLGVSADAGVAARVSDPDFAEKQQAARAFIVAKVDAGIPCVGWDGGFPEYVTINGYTPDAVVEWTYYVDGGYRVMPWAKFGRNDTDNFSVFSLEPVTPPGDEREAILKALEFALSQRAAAGLLNMNHASGMQGYELWLRCLETGEWRRNPFWGVHHNVACWSECRVYAEAFLRLAGRTLGGEFGPLCEAAADHYKAVRTALGRMQEVFLYKYPQPPVSPEGEAHATELLRRARDAEVLGLAAIGQIVERLKAQSSAPNQVSLHSLRIETKRLILRPFTIDDWRDFQQLSVDWAAAPGPAFDKWPTSAEASQASVKHMSTSAKYLAMCLRDSGKVVGLLAINGVEPDGQLDVGHVVLSEYQDDDCDREALEAFIRHCFATFAAPAVVTHNADDAPQLAPLRSLGFTTKDPTDRGTLVISRDEWERRHGRP